MTATIELSVVIPVYNEVENLRPLVAELTGVLSGVAQSYEILLVDDGSRDDSVAVARALQRGDSHVRVIALDRNHGQTAALDAGFKHARGNSIIMLDADRQNDPADIPKLLNALHDHDMAIGWRPDRQDSLVRRVSSWIANTVRNRLSRETVRDTGCSLKAFKSEIVRKVKLYEGLHRFLPTLAKLEGYSVIEIPVNHRPRLLGKSKYGVFNRVFKSFKDLLVIRWMQWRQLRYQARELPPDDSMAIDSSLPVAKPNATME